jgi:DNA-binding HxlR family transcriptional regulator
LIRRDLPTDTKRFGELPSSLKNISPKHSPNAFVTYELQGALDRVQFPGIPPRIEYAVTEKGWGVDAIIEAMAYWSSRQM